MKKDFVKVTYWNDAHTKSKTIVIDPKAQEKEDRNMFLDSVMEFAFDGVLLGGVLGLIQMLYLIW